MQMGVYMHVLVCVCSKYVLRNPKLHVYVIIYIHTPSMYLFDRAVKEHSY